MKRFFLGLLFGVVVTGEAIFLAGVGHGTYAPLALATSITFLVPILSLVAGPLLWALYFFLIPKMHGGKITLALLTVLLFHLIPGLWLAFEDPAFADADSGGLLIFCASFLAAIAFLLYFCFRRGGVENSNKQ
jgi:hypothetical protein